MKLTLIKAQPQSVSIPELIAQATAAGDAAVQALQVRPGQIEQAIGQQMPPQGMPPQGSADL